MKPAQGFENSEDYHQKGFLALKVSLVGSGFLACGKVKKALKTRGKSWAFTMTSSAELLLLIPRLNRLKPWTV